MDMVNPIIALVALAALVAPAGAWPPAPSLAARRASYLEDALVAPGDSISLSRYWAGLPPGERRALAARLRAMAVSRLPPGLTAGEEWPAAVRPLVADLVALERAADPAALERWMATHDLDRFAPLPAGVLKVYQDALLAENGRQATLDADRAEPRRWRAERDATPAYLPRPEEGDTESARLATRLNEAIAGQSWEPLVASLGDEVTVFDARTFVNFLDHVVPGGPAVRIPTWGVAEVEGIPGKPLVMPVFHSEYLLATYGAGEVVPRAVVKWFLGVPADTGQGTLFRPATERRRAWTGYRIVHAFEGRAAAQRMVGVAAGLMRAYNFMQRRYAFPMGAYGVLGVCNDSSAWLERALTGATTAWPLVRDVRFDLYLPEAPGMPSDPRPDLYPEVRDREQVLYRVGMNVPVHDSRRLQFPDLAREVPELARTSPAMARGLAERPRSR